MCPLLAQLIVGFFSFLLQQPFTVLMKKTHAVKQSIFLDVYENNCLKLPQMSGVEAMNYI
jgi:hypothetical protein